MSTISIPPTKSNEILSTSHKALHINLHTPVYGTIAEIGAGQEVARQFFLVGGASGTIAKSLSAYDMNVSDAIYGVEKSGRYVARPRLESMLRREYTLNIKRVANHRPENTCFFAFADTVAAKAYRSNRDCHGWMGITFQDAPGAQPSKIVLHLRMLDNSHQAQQAALGVLGVNLIYGAYQFTRQPEQLLDSLKDNLRDDQIEINFIEFSGPAFDRVDNLQMNLRLITARLGQVIMFGTQGTSVVPGEALYKKNLLVLRGTFRPYLDLHGEMMQRGLHAFCQINALAPQSVACLYEMNLSQQIHDQSNDVADMAERIGRLTDLGYQVLVSSYLRYFRLSEFFTQYNQRAMGFVLSVDNILTILDESYYESMAGGGGMLEAMGKLFSSGAKLLVYPLLTDDGAIVTADSVMVPDKQKYLYRHLMYNKQIIALHPHLDSLVPMTYR